MEIRKNFMEWAHAHFPHQNRPAPARTFEAAESHPLTFSLMQATGLPSDEAAWLAGVCSNLHYTHPNIWKSPWPAERFLYVWATQAPDLRASKRRHINEGRFMRWLDNAARYDGMTDWYANTLEALKVIRGHDFDVASLADIAAARCDEDLPDHGAHSFLARCAFDFHLHQRKGQDGKQPQQQNIKEFIGYGRI